LHNLAGSGYGFALYQRISLLDVPAHQHGVRRNAKYQLGGNHKHEFDGAVVQCAANEEVLYDFVPDVYSGSIKAVVWFFLYRCTQR
ncbi:hypothetical protein KI387_041766, partial [Taxus chinensis]